MWRFERSGGVRELRAAVIECVVKRYVISQVTHAAATHLESVKGITAVEQITPDLIAEAMDAVRHQVLASFLAKDGDSRDRFRFSELVARSLAGFGDRLEPDVLSVNDGDPQLMQLQELLKAATTELP